MGCDEQEPHNDIVGWLSIECFARAKACLHSHNIATSAIVGRNVGIFVDSENVAKARQLLRGDPELGSHIVFPDEVEIQIDPATNHVTFTRNQDTT